MAIKTLDDKNNGKVFALIAGNSGIGKTTLVTQFPKKETLLLDIEKGSLSISGSGYAYDDDINSYEDLVKAILNPPTWVKYLFIDSLSESYNLIRKQLNTEFDRKQNFAKFEEMNLRMFWLLRKAKELPIDVYFTAHTKEEKNGLDIEHELSFDGKLPGDIKKQFDVVLHMVVDEESGERKFITSPEVSKVAKVRNSPWLKTKIENVEEANLYKLTNKLKGLE